MFHRRRRALPAFRGCLEAELGSKPLPVSGWDPRSPTLPSAYMVSVFLSPLSGTLLLQIAGSSLFPQGLFCGPWVFCCQNQGPWHGGGCLMHATALP